MVKLSMMSYTMARYKEFDLKKMMELTVALKLDGLDMVTLYGKPAKEIRKMADDYGVPVVCYTFCPKLNSEDPAVFNAAVDECKQGFEDAVTLGAPAVMLVTPGCRAERNQQRRLWVKGFKQVAPFAEKTGVAMSVENFPGEDSPFVTAADFFDAQKDVPNLKLTFDNGNAGSGEDPAESFTKCAKYAVHAHFKDWDIQDQPADGWRKMLDGRYYRPALIGEGKINHKACLTAMKKAGYKGCINIEYEGQKYNGEESIRRATAYLREVAAAI